MEGKIKEIEKMDRVDRLVIVCGYKDEENR